ncbi:hypothetical protein T10_195 [Trichinella papuae]|uniref:Uncharacterized protein n=1 Tax=Trichinella papuae TaxID=268474 RepID=A0A0V1M202_9BILA|nr:hypothetical protein T10_195 [Trichinella papuae]
MAAGVHTASVQTWPATTTATHISDRQNSLSARRIPPKFSWLLGPSVVTEKNRRWKLEPKQQATFVEVKNHLTSLPLPRRSVFTRYFIMEIGKSKEALKTLVSHKMLALMWAIKHLWSFPYNQNLKAHIDITSYAGYTPYRNFTIKSLVGISGRI